MVVFDTAEKVLETFYGMVEVKLEVKNVVRACGHPSGATACKSSFWLPITGFYDLCFKKRDRQVGNVIDGMDFIDIYRQVADVFLVDRVVLRLKTKER